MCAGDAVGGIGIPEIGLDRDALGAAVMLMDAIARDGRPLSAMASELDETLGHMEYGRRELSLGAGEAQMLRVALPGINPPSIAGLKVEGVSHPSHCLRLALPEGAWVLVAPSPAGPTALLAAEAPTRAMRDELLAAAAELARSPLSRGDE